MEGFIETSWKMCMMKERCVGFSVLRLTFKSVIPQYLRISLNVKNEFG